MAAISRRSVRERLEMATAERTDLADLLATLTLQQWEAPSLCERWRVRDVVAHVMSSTASPCPTCFTAPSAVASSTSTRSTWTNSHRSAPNSSWTGCVLTFDRKGWPPPSGPAGLTRCHHPSSRHPSPARNATPDPSRTTASRPGRQPAQPRAPRVAPLPWRTPDPDRPGLESRLRTRNHRTGRSRSDGSCRPTQRRRGAGRSRAAGTRQPARPLTTRNAPSLCALLTTRWPTVRAAGTGGYEVGRIASTPMTRPVSSTVYRPAERSISTSEFPKGSTTTARRPTAIA